MSFEVYCVEHPNPFLAASSFATPLTPRSINTPARQDHFMATSAQFPFSKPSSLPTTFLRTFMPPSPPITPPAIAKAWSADSESRQQNQETRAGATEPSTSSSIFSFNAPATTTSAPIPARRMKNQNPLTASAEERRKRRRNEYLDSVREKRDSEVFDGRGDRVRLLLATCTLTMRKLGLIATS